MRSVGGRSLRRLWVATIASAALVMVSPHAARAEPGVPVPPNGLITDTGKGTVTAADKDFVTRVRLAGLWEIPAGEMAQQKSDDPRIREIGRDISAQHKVLDKLTRDAAKKLDITLPDEPNADQQTWLGEMQAAEGKDFDEVYIDRLRAAHGKIFPAIATIRASTRNDTVRKLAQRANQFVMTHMTLLESSGIVDFKALPTAPNPSASASTAAARTTSALQPAAETRGLGAATTPLLIATLAAILLVGMLATRYLLVRRSRRAHRH
jgi:predicted outer membrane protein